MKAYVKMKMDRYGVKPHVIGTGTGDSLGLLLVPGRGINVEALVLLVLGSGSLTSGGLAGVTKSGGLSRCGAAAGGGGEALVGITETGSLGSFRAAGGV